MLLFCLMLFNKCVIWSFWNFSIAETKLNTVRQKRREPEECRYSFLSRVAKFKSESSLKILSSSLNQDFSLAFAIDMTVNLVMLSTTRYLTAVMHVKGGFKFRKQPWAKSTMVSLQCRHVTLNNLHYKWLFNTPDNYRNVKVSSFQKILKESLPCCFIYKLIKLKWLRNENSAHIHLCCGRGVCAASVLLLTTGSGCVGLSCHHWTKHQILTHAAAPAPLLCGTPTSPRHNQATPLLWLCPSGARTGAPGHLTWAAACGHSAGCNKEAWPPVCWGHWKRQSLCSERTGRCGSVSGWGPASCPHRHFGRPWNVTASGWQWGDISQSSLCGRAGTLNVTT